MKKVLILIGLLLAASQVALAEDIETLLKNFNKYVEQGNYTKALKELDWVKQEVQKQNAKKIEAFLPDQLAGLQGQNFQTNSAMGMTNIERKYTGDEANVKVSLTGGGPGGAMGGLAAFGQMAAMMGGQPGTEAMRIKGRTAQLNAKEGSKRGDLTIFLESGSMLKLEMSKNMNPETLKTMANEINIEGLDNYLRGVG